MEQLARGEALHFALAHHCLVIGLFCLYLVLAPCKMCWGCKLAVQSRVHGGIDSIRVSGNHCVVSRQVQKLERLLHKGLDVFLSCHSSG